MALFDLADPRLPLPTQLVLDSSILLALRPGDDNPQARSVRQFMRRVMQSIADYQMVGWLLTPVLQECYHIILSRSLRRAWEAMPPQDRPPNWLAAYKQHPSLLALGLAEIDQLDAILSDIPLTPAQPEDFTNTAGQTLNERMLYFITTYHLLPQDALILAESERLGVTAVATLDRDWRRVTEFDIYTTPVR